MLLAKFTELYAFFEKFWVFSVKQQAQSGDQFLLFGVQDINFEFALFIVITKNLDGFPSVLVLAEAWGQCVGFLWPLRTMVKPLLDCSVTVPCVVAWQCFYGHHIWIVENLVFFLQDGESLSCGLVLVDFAFVFRQKRGLFDDMFVNFTS